MKRADALNFNFEASDVRNMTFHQLPEARMEANLYFQHRKTDSIPYRANGRILIITMPLWSITIRL